MAPLMPPPHAERVEGACEAMTGVGQRRNYADGRNLAKRRARFDYLDGERPYGGDPLSLLQWSAQLDVLDAGCGSGLFLA